MKRVAVESSPTSRFSSFVISSPESPTKKVKRRETKQSTKDKKFAKLSPEKQFQVLTNKRLVEYMQENDTGAAIQWFDTLSCEDLSKLSSDNFGLLLRILSVDEELSKYEKIIEIYEKMERLNKHSEPCCSLVTRALAKRKNFKKAEEMVEKMRANGFNIRLRTVSPILRAYCESVKLNEHSFERVKHLYRLVRESVQESDMGLTLEDYSSVIHALIDLKSVESLKSDVKSFFIGVLSDAANEVLVPEQPLVNAVSEWYKDDREWTVKSNCEVCDTGICTGCGKQLHSLELSRDDELNIMKKTDALVNIRGGNQYLAKKWQIFKQWLANRAKRSGPDGAYDCVIDAANVAYFDQNYEAKPKFRFELLDIVMKHLESRGFRPLIILHESHLQKRDCYKPQHREFIDQTKKARKIYFVPRGHNDDWYWLYATVWRGGDTFIVSNDLMRDHHFLAFRQQIFQRWRERHQATFSARWDRHQESASHAEVSIPGPFSKRIQLEIENDPRLKRSKGTVMRLGNYEGKGNLTGVHIPVCLREIRGQVPGQPLPYKRDIPEANELSWLCCCQISK